VLFILPAGGAYLPCVPSCWACEVWADDSWEQHLHSLCVDKPDINSNMYVTLFVLINIKLGEKHLSASTLVDDYNGLQS